jgi:peptidoglycan/LPS O-acetylase OafA/YrhL
MSSLVAERQAEFSDPGRVHFGLADALRATAILAVVFHHVAYMTNPTLGNHRPVIFGYLGIWGVNCFFLLSGYLLGRPYVAMLLDPKRKAPSTKLFYLRRFLRIYPLYAVGIILSIAVGYLVDRSLPSAFDVTAHLLMLQTLTKATAESINGPMWTMPVDAEFYLVLPLCAFAMAALLRGKSEASRLRILLATFAALFVGSILFRLIVLLLVPAARDDFALGVVLIRNVVGFAGTFALGMFLALLGMKFSHRLAGKPIFFRSLFVAGVLLALSQLTNRADVVTQGHESFTAIVRLAFNEALASISVGAILLGLSESELPLVARFTRTKAVASAAALAYAVYLIHWPIIEFVDSIIKAPQGLRALFELGLLSAIPIFVVALLMHAYIERPLLAIKDRKRDAKDWGVAPSPDDPVPAWPVPERTTL